MDAFSTIFTIIAMLWYGCALSQRLVILRDSFLVIWKMKIMMKIVTSYFCLLFCFNAFDHCMLEVKNDVNFIFVRF